MRCLYFIRSPKNWCLHNKESNKLYINDIQPLYVYGNQLRYENTVFFIIRKIAIYMLCCILYSTYIISSPLATTFGIRREPNYLAGQNAASKMDAYETFEFRNIDKYINEYKYKLQQFIHLLLLLLLVLGIH